MIDHLKDILDRREKQMDDATELFERMAIRADQSNRDRLADTGRESDDELRDQLKEIINVPGGSKIIIDERISGVGDKSLHINSYDKVMKRVDERQIPGKETYKKKVGTFVPNRCSKAKAVGELADNVMHDIQTIEGLTPTNHSRSDRNPKIISPGKTLQQQPPLSTQSDQSPSGRLRYRYDDSLESSIHGGCGKHQKAQPIGVQEAIALQQRQKKVLQVWCGLQTKLIYDEYVSLVYVCTVTWLLSS